MKKNPISCWSGLEKKIHQYHHTWLQTSVMFPNYAMIKTGPGTAGHPYPVWPGTGNGTRRTGSHSVRHISGLPVSMAMPILETLRYFYPNLSQLRRGRFCSFVFVIITNSLLLLLCRSDLIKDAVKKYDEKTKKSALLYSFYNQSSCFFI